MKKSEKINTTFSKCTKIFKRPVFVHFHLIVSNTESIVWSAELILSSTEPIAFLLRP